MQSDELLLRLVFSNQMLFCGIFGALGGIVHALDLRSSLSLSGIISKIIVSSSAGLLLFFATYDFDKLSPALRITAAIVSGFYGSLLFRLLARSYMSRQALNTNLTQDIVDLRQPDNTNNKKQVNDDAGDQ